jgi:formate dehydrogenase gamma subunit
MGGNHFFLITLVAASLGFGRLVAEAATPGITAEPIKDSFCLDCHSDKTLTMTNAAGKTVSLSVDPAKIAASAHKTNSCASCHSDLTTRHPDDGVVARPVSCGRCHERQSDSYGASVHGLALKAGRADAATCQDCHESHEVLPPSSPISPLHFSKQAATCGQCHEQEARDLATSVHGQALALGKRDAPTCTDCHFEHKIEALKGTAGLRISADICSKCHASERLNTKYRLPADRVKTFFESYHGLAAQYGSTLAANCASCHGFHKILPSSDPASTIHKAHLTETCGKCHPGASEKFAQSSVHVDITTAKAEGNLGLKVNWWVRRIYLVLIFGVIGAMLIHNGLIFARKVRTRYRGTVLTIVRMNFSQRMQHMILAVSFIVLALSGFALRFPESWLAKMLGSSEPLRRWIHRIAGVVLLVAGAYHLIYIVATREGRKLAKDLLPNGKDVKDAVTNARYLAGLSRLKARFGRFGYPEKMEYWAVVWGTIIMGVTGLMIWFKVDVTNYLPRWLIDVALTIHYYEAILACLAIVVWHFYHVIFDPDVYPLNWTCWDGRVSEHWQEEEHPLEINGADGVSPEAPVLGNGHYVASSSGGSDARADETAGHGRREDSTIQKPD